MGVDEVRWPVDSIAGRSHSDGSPDALYAMHLPASVKSRSRGLHGSIESRATSIFRAMKSITADAIDLRSKSPLGEWDVSADISQCEYQFGQRLIYVQHPKGDSPRRYVEAAQCWVRDAWLDIDAAVKFAEARSKPLFPEFWEFHKRSGHPGALLDVYSIHFNSRRASHVLPLVESQLRGHLRPTRWVRCMARHSQQ